MKKKEWNEGLNHLDPDLVEKYVEQKDRVAHKKKPKGLWLRFGAIAACSALIVGAIMIVPKMRENDPGIIPNPETTDENNGPSIPIVNIQAPSSAPNYYGNESSVSTSSSQIAEIVTDGISATARFVEALPDTYTFFDDWEQNEFRLIKMETISLLTGSEMTDEFYFIVPVEFMTDFSIYDTFVISHMGQYGYDFSVLYNVTQQCAETLDTIIFGESVIRYDALGTTFKAFDENGMIDLRLWSSTEAWSSMTKSWLEHGVYDSSFTKEQGENEAIENAISSLDRYVHTLDDASGEAKNVLGGLKNFEYGLFVPSSTNKLWLEPEIQLTCRRFVNGFVTNETIRLEGQNTVTHSKAQFTEDDLNALPDLPSTYATIKALFESDELLPPHIQNHTEMTNTTHGIFGWYAKTEDGIIGIVRVTWCFVSNDYNLCYDDAYYIIEYGSDECKPIDRDELLDKFGEYEKTYIYTGEYDELGKVYDH